MTDESKNTKIPALRRHGIQSWLEEFNGILMGYKRAHLALKDPRPERNPELENQIQGNATKLRHYQLDLKELQDDWDERNDIVRSRLLEAVKDNENAEARQLIHTGIRENKTAKEIVNQLTSRFDSTDTRVINAAIKRFTSMKAAQGEKATSFITRLEEQKEQLRLKGKIFNDGELVGRLLEGLKDADKYKMNIAALETVKDLKYNDAVEQLQTKDEADTATEGITETAHMAETTAGTKQNQETITCQICKKKGHSAVTCRFREKKPSGDNKFQGKSSSKGNNNQRKETTRDMREIKCFNCNKNGHYARDCRGKKKKREREEDTTDSDRNSSKPKSKGNWDSADTNEFSGMFQEDQRGPK
jgi:hypothetical protein